MEEKQSSNISDNNNHLILVQPEVMTSNVECAERPRRTGEPCTCAIWLLCTGAKQVPSKAQCCPSGTFLRDA